MKRMAIAVFASLLVVATGANAGQSTDDDATLQQLEQSWVHATTTGDRAALNRLLDDSYVETTANGTHRSKLDVLSAPPPPPGSTQVLRDVTVRLNGDTAIVTGINRFTLSSTTQPADYSFTDVFVRRDGGWRVASSQMTRR